MNLYRPTWLLSLALTLCPACDSDDADSPDYDRVHVGEVAQTDVMLSAIIENDEVTVYMCGGDDTFATHTRWFQGPLDEDGRFELRTEEWTLAGEADVGEFDGTLVDPAGTERSWSVAVADSEFGGLYTNELDGCTTGVVIQNDGRAQGTWCNDQGAFSQVIILEPFDLVAGGLQVEVERPEGSRESFVVEPF